MYFYSAFLLYNLDFILLWNIFNAICFTCFIFVNSVIVSSIISCNDLYQNFIIMYVWYFVSRNSISEKGAIWPSLSPCTVINQILLTENFDIPCTDVFMKIQPFISSLWQERLDKEVDNKLHAIMPQIDEKYYSGCTNRKDEVIINRIRIGHTRLTHSFRMENRPHPP